MPGFQAFVISGVKFRLTRISASHAAGLGTGNGAGNWERSWEPGTGLGTGTGARNWEWERGWDRGWELRLPQPCSHECAEHICLGSGSWGHVSNSASEREISGKEFNCE